MTDSEEGQLKGLFSEMGYCSFAYSALACFRMGMSGSASFQRVTAAAPSGVAGPCSGGLNEYYRDRGQL